jgi:hypothetical protein
MTPTGNISAISLTTELYGQKAIDTLVQFAPDEIRSALREQVFCLDWLLETGRTSNLGISDGYEWYLAVCETPSPRLVQLRVIHAVLRHMPIAEGLKIERDAMNRAHPEVRDMVRAFPIDIPDYELREYIWENIRKGHHWSHGLC